MFILSISNSVTSVTKNLVFSSSSAVLLSNGSTRRERTDLDLARPDLAYQYVDILHEPLNLPVPATQPGKAK